LHNGTANSKSCDQTFINRIDASSLTNNGVNYLPKI